LGESCNRDFGDSFAQFKEKFTSAAITLLGSGWACLSRIADGNFYNMKSAECPVCGWGADESPMKRGKRKSGPKFFGNGVDVWGKHA
jgi:hypothetical protein